MSIYRSAVKHPVTTTLIFVACAILGVAQREKVVIPDEVRLLADERSSRTSTQIPLW